ncbi:DUF6079 family protein [Kitasatospora sp. NPDC056731]|uniref:DUF6079 family protein n=1 Tax=Kitasatospora sp. NPDC056731 TaxID=3155422 RepID=UPI0034275ADB
MSSTDLFLRDVLDIPDAVLAGKFKVELSGGFEETQRLVDEYVVTDQLKEAFGKALTLVRSSVRDGSSNAAYLHGSFGSGKSHFMAVLHAVLNNEPAARSKPRLQEVIAEHDDWLRDRRFLMVPYHLVGAADLDSALLGGYVRTIRRIDPNAPTPPVYRADAMLDDARYNRSIEGDDLFIRKLGDRAVSGGTGHPNAADEDDLVPLEEAAAPSTGWTSADLDRAFAAPPGDPLREALVSALLSGPMKSYARGASGDANAFIPLEDGLSVISRHAKSLGYDGIVLFLDELVLWLQARMSDQDFVKTEVGKLVKIIESGVADRPVPIVSFVSRQRNLSQLVGEDVTGAEVKNLESQVGYLAQRFDVINLEDRNLPAIIKERVLKPRSPEARDALDSAFADFEQANARVKDALLDSQGATQADWSDFRDVYPLTPALLNVLVALSGALQRERTGLKLLQDLLWRRREDMKVGQIIPLGDLWDVLSGGMGDAFTEKLRKEGGQANRFYEKVRPWMVERYQGEGSADFRATDRLVKTLLLAYLTPEVPALARLTARRLADLNHGSVKRTRTITDDKVALARLEELQGEFGGELRSDGGNDPVFALHLSDLDVEPLLDAVGEVDRVSARRVWIKETLWNALDIKDTEGFVCEHEIVWRGTKRTAEFVFGNVRDAQEIPDDHFIPSVDGRVRFVIDYPFDIAGQYPSNDAARVRQLLRDERHHQPTVVWLPAHLSRQRAGQLGRLLKINYVLERERLDDLAVNYSAEDRIRMRHQLQAQRDNLSSQLTVTLGQLYGISRLDEANAGAPVGEDGHLLSMLPGHRPRLEAAAGFKGNMLRIADGVFQELYPKHPNFDPSGNRKAITPAELKTVLGWITKAMEDGSGRVELDRGQMAVVKKIVHPLELGEVHDGPLTLSTEWRRRIDQYAAQQQVTGEYKVEDIRQWIAKLGWTGLDKQVSSLLIATYALLADRSWVYNGKAEPSAPALPSIGAGHVLRAQEKPSEAEFATARDRAAALFGVSGVPPVLFARNVAKLAAAVRAKAEAVEPAVEGVRSSLGKPQHATALGLGDSRAPRLLAARHAADLVQRLTRHQDDTPLVKELAAVAYDITDQELGAAVGSAKTVLEALDRTQWDLLESVREYTGRTDGIGDRAQRLIAEVERAAHEDEFARQLAPVLDKIQPQSLALIRDAARLAAVATPVAPPAAPPGSSPTPEEPPTEAGQVSLTFHGQPPLPTTPTEPSTPAAPAGTTAAAGPEAAVPRRSTRRVAARAGETAFERALADLLGEIREFAATNPDTEIEIGWKPADEPGAGGSVSEGAAQ